MEKPIEQRNHRLDHKIKGVKTDDLIWHLHEYDVDIKSNHIYLMGTETYVYGNGQVIDEPGIEYTIANKFIRNFNLLMRINPDMPIVVHMKTCGGYYEEGMAIYDTIRSCPWKVTILNYTHARSMSSIILQAANKRVMMPHSYFMFHEGSLNLSGTYKGVQSNAEFAKLGNETMLNIYTLNMKQRGIFSHKKESEIKTHLKYQMNKKEDVFLSPQEAIDYGLADEIFDYNWKSLTEYTEEQERR